MNNNLAMLRLGMLPHGLMLVMDVPSALPSGEMKLDELADFIESERVQLTILLAKTRPAFDHLRHAFDEPSAEFLAHAFDVLSTSLTDISLLKQAIPAEIDKRLVDMCGTHWTLDCWRKLGASLVKTLSLNADFDSQWRERLGDVVMRWNDVPRRYRTAYRESQLIMDIVKDRITSSSSAQHVGAAASTAVDDAIRRKSLVSIGQLLLQQLIIDLQRPPESLILTFCGARAVIRNGVRHETTNQLLELLRILYEARGKRLNSREIADRSSNGALDAQAIANQRRTNAYKQAFQHDIKSRTGNKYAGYRIVA